MKLIKHILSIKIDFIIFFIATVLITVPLKPIFGSLAVILFATYSLSFFYKLNFKPNTALFLPIGLYVLMVLSLFWTTSFDKTLSCLQKEASILVMPLTFVFLPKFDKKAFLNRV